MLPNALISFLRSCNPLQVSRFSVFFIIFKFERKCWPLDKFDIDHLTTGRIYKLICSTSKYWCLHQMNCMLQVSLSPLQLKGILPDFIQMMLSKMSKFEFFASFCGSPPRSMFPQRNYVEIIPLWNDSHFLHKILSTRLSSLWSSASAHNHA